MDEETSVLHNELCRLFDEAMDVLSKLRILGAPGTKPQASELSKTVTATCKQLRSRMRELEQLAEEQDTTYASLQVEQLVKQHKQQYERLKHEQENSFAEMKKNTEMAWRKQRQELLSGGAPRSQIKDERTAITASEGITESLRRTRQLMTEQIGATEANTQLIGTSTSALGKTKAELDSQKGMFKSSRRLLRTMSWYDVIDKIVLYGGVGFFLLVVVYILQKRMLGLTPEFIKSSVSGLVGSSMDKAGALYEQYVRSAVTTEDPAKPFLPHFDDLAETEEDELITTEVVDAGVESVASDKQGRERVDPGGEEPLLDEVGSADPYLEEELENTTGSEDKVDVGGSDAGMTQETDATVQQEDPSQQPSDGAEEQKEAGDAEEDDPYLVIPTKDSDLLEEDEYLDVDEEEDEYLDVDDEEATAREGDKDEL